MAMGWKHGNGPEAKIVPGWGGGNHPKENPVIRRNFRYDSGFSVV
jgi:hypothetical protein